LIKLPSKCNIGVLAAILDKLWKTVPEFVVGHALGVAELWVVLSSVVASEPAIHYS
jgi:hypothetical protein